MKLGTWFLIGCYLLWITPIRLGAVFAWQSGAKPRFATGALCWGIRLSSLAKRPRSAPLSLPYILRNLRKTPYTRWLFRRALHFEQGSIIAVIGGQDAAWVALFSAAFKSLFSCFPRIRCQVQPCFGGASALKAGCIVEGRLGMLLLAALALILSERGTAKKEEQAWIIPSGN